MARRPTVPCAGECGALLWQGTTSLGPGKSMCQPCRAKRRPPPWQPHEATCSGCKQPMWMEKATRRYCDTCRIEYRRTHPPQRRSSVDSPSKSKRSGRPRRRATEQVRATQTHCHLCGYHIDLTLDRQRHPLASSVDELIPVAHGGSITDPANLAHAHRVCNGSRGTKPITAEVRARCKQLVNALLTAQTTRTW